MQLATARAAGDHADLAAADTTSSELLAALSEHPERCLDRQRIIGARPTADEAATAASWDDADTASRPSTAHGHVAAVLDLVPWQ